MIDFDQLTLCGRNARVHGNGFIQIDLEVDGETGNERIHIFGLPGLPRQDVPTPIHDHRFGFTSEVLKGRLTNVVYNLLPISGMTPTHAAYKPAPRVGEDTELVLTDEVGVLQVWTSHTYLPGHRYLMQPGALHETLTNEVTITHMRKIETIAHLVPRVLCPIGATPDNDFTRYDISSDALWRMIEQAFRG